MIGGEKREYSSNCFEVDMHYLANSGRVSSSKVSKICCNAGV